jgi:hypothetical protein
MLDFAASPCGAQRMRHPLRSSLLRRLGAAGAVVGALAFGPAFPQDAASLDGAWQGSLTMVHGPGLGERDFPAQTWRILINGDTARAYILREGKTEEIKAGQFHLSRDRSNAVITAVDSGKDKDGEWIETEAFELLLRSPGEILVTFAGAVNNVGESLDKPTSKFMTVRTGVFHPVK